MANRGPIYAKIRTSHGAYADYGRHIHDSGLRTLDVLGRGAAAAARSMMTRVDTGATKKSIRYFREGKVVYLGVGTMAGAVHEFGRKRGARGGEMKALGYLRRGMGQALKLQLPILRAQVARKRVRARRPT